MDRTGVVVDGGEGVEGGIASSVWFPVAGAVKSEIHYMLNNLTSDILIKICRVIATWTENSVCEMDNRKQQLLTRFKLHLAQEYPSGVKVEFNLDKFADFVRYRDHDIAGVVYEGVPQILVFHGLRLVVPAPDTEVDQGPPEHAHVLGEVVVTVQPDCREVSDDVEAEVDLYGSGGQRVVLPANPLVPLLSGGVPVQPEVALAHLYIGELAETAGQMVFHDLAVVGQVVQVHLGTPSLTLPSVVRHHAICNTERHLNP